MSSDLPPPEAALLRGMALGQDEALGRSLRDDFRAAGLSHLLAASGQNVMLLGALALPVLALAGLGLRPRLAVVMLLVAVYVPLAGAGPSIQRAGVMGGAGLLAALAGRPASRWYAVLLAAAVTLLLNPRTWEDPGWQLSFAAVVAILALAPESRKALRARRVPGGLAEAVALTTAATIGTAPLIAFHFQQVSLVSLPANVLAAPVVAPLMWLGMLAAAVGQVSPALAAPLGALAAPLLGYLEWLARTAAAVPAASLPIGLRSPLSVAAVHLALAGSAATLLRLRRPARRGRIAARVGLVAALVVLVAVPWWAGASSGAAGPGPPAPGALRVSFLDVGQGDATLVQEDGHAVLVDTGPPGAHLLPLLRTCGVRRLDVLVVTHAQADHEGGAAGVIGTVPVGMLLDGGSSAATAEHVAIRGAAALRRVRTVVPEAGQVVRAGPLELDVLWPARAPPGAVLDGDPNDRAVVARLRSGAFDLLLTADAESNVTSGLPLTEADVLKVAHHGSADEGLPGLLERVRPRLAVIEVGRRNTYGHPTPETLTALARAGVPVLRTDRDGTVSLTVTEGRMRVATDR